MNTIVGLEEFIDSYYKPLMSGETHKAPGALSANGEAVETITSTPSKAAATNEGIKQSFEDYFNKNIKPIKERMMISPIAGSESDDDVTKLNPSLNDTESRIREDVLNSISSVVGEFMESAIGKFQDMVNSEIEKLYVVSQSVAENREDVAPTPDDYAVMQSEIDVLQEENKELRDLLRVSEGRLTRAEKQIHDLSEELLQLQARSMRDNLVFYNIPESKDEPTHCSGTLQGFLKNEMNISDENMAQISFDRVHRLGKPGVNPRPIVAKFNPYKGKGIVMAHVKNLDKTKKFGVNDQLPRELEERKKQLLPKFKAARKDQKKPKWQVDKLVVGKEVTEVKKDQVNDININTNEIATQLKIKHGPQKTYTKSSFQGHHVAINNQDSIIPALHAIYADSRVARATHNIYAYRIQTQSGVTEHYDDDGEWGAGKKLLELLRENQITDNLVCVTRWYGGTHLGKDRFKYIIEAAKETLGI